MGRCRCGVEFVFFCLLFLGSPVLSLSLSTTGYYHQAGTGRTSVLRYHSILPRSVASTGMVFGMKDEGTQFYHGGMNVYWIM
jgi:hypothetical protein